jgi:hypothetical protein
MKATPTITGLDKSLREERERARNAGALAQVHREERDACAREVLSQRDTIARLTSERNEARAALREYAARCPDCDALATRRSDGDAYDHRSRLHCDACAPADASADVLHADALRAAKETQ